MSTALAIGAALAVGCLVYVLYPLIRGGARDTGAPARRRTAPVSDDDIEAAVRAYRDTHVVGSDCVVCGPRPETDAVFCSNCGRRLVEPRRSAL